MQNFITIKSYSYTNLLIGYGPNKEITVSVYWCNQTKGYKLIFNGGNTAINAHSMMQEQLQAHLNRHHNLSQIVHLLHETYQPMSSIAKLPIIPQLGIPVSDTLLMNDLNDVHEKHSKFDFIFSSISLVICSDHQFRFCHFVFCLNRQRCYVFHFKQCTVWRFVYGAVV